MAANQQVVGFKSEHFQTAQLIEKSGFWCSKYPNLHMAVEMIVTKQVASCQYIPFMEALVNHAFVQYESGMAFKVGTDGADPMSVKRGKTPFTAGITRELRKRFPLRKEVAAALSSKLVKDCEETIAQKIWDPIEEKIDAYEEEGHQQTWKEFFSNIAMSGSTRVGDAFTVQDEAQEAYITLDGDANFTQSTGNELTVSLDISITTIVARNRPLSEINANPGKFLQLC